MMRFLISPLFSTSIDSFDLTLIYMFWKTIYLIFCRAMRTYQITVLEKHSHKVKTTKWIIPKVSLCSHILFKVGKERRNLFAFSHSQMDHNRMVNSEFLAAFFLLWWLNKIICFHEPLAYNVHVNIELVIRFLVIDWGHIMISLD